MHHVSIDQTALQANDRIAAGLRRQFAEHATHVFNLISSPGSGKTSFLERTLEALPKELKVAVLAGDLEGGQDARRLARTGFPARQINTGGACHLEARMIEDALRSLVTEPLDLLLIENVGDLVRPAGYDLGEDCRVVMLSVAEGEDAPLRYSSAFFKSDVMILNKTDLLPQVPCDVKALRRNARIINPNLQIFETSCATGAGLDRWMRWLGVELGIPQLDLISPRAGRPQKLSRIPANAPMEAPGA